MSRFGLGFLAVLVLPALVFAGPQVTIETLDGTTYRGEIVKETKSAIVLAIKRGTITGNVRIPRNQIKGDKPKLATPPAAEVYAKRLAQVRTLKGAQRADALQELAKEIELQSDPALAAELYDEAGTSDPARRDQTDVEAARAYIAADREVDAERVLRKALERNPKNAQARAAVRSLEKAFETKAQDLLEPGIEAFLANQPRTALRKLVDAVDALPASVLEEASQRIQDKTGMTLAQIMVDCRLRAVCKTCEGAGVSDCPLSKGTTNYRCRFGRRVHFGRIERVGRTKFNLWERCTRCNGLGRMNCKPCMGLGMHLSKPSAYEREELVKALRGELQGLEERAAKVTQRVEDDKRESAVRSVAATELINLLQDIRVYARSLSKLDPRAGARGGGGLRAVEKTSSQRAAAVMTALANALYVGGEQRYEKAVNYDSPFNENAQLVSPAVRAMQAKQAYEIVNQARNYMLEALELDPRAAGPTRGDLKRRLELTDRFLKRSWKTYLALRAVEEKWADSDLDPNEMLRNALRGGALGQGGGNDKVKGNGKDTDTHYQGSSK